jgi:hypothetical protein
MVEDDKHAHEDGEEIDYPSPETQDRSGSSVAAGQALTNKPLYPAVQQNKKPDASRNNK